MGAELADIPLPRADGVAIARQAIHDRWQRTIGYALLFCGLPDVDAEQAVAAAIVETFTGIGLGALVGRRRAHVRVSHRFLLEGQPFALPPDRVVLELPAPDRRDEPVLSVLEQLSAQRYRVVLVCDPRAPVPPPTVARFSHGVKLDVCGLGSDELAVCAQRYLTAFETLYADGVDTPAQLRHCRAAGFHAFQGFHYCEPDLIPTQAPPSTHVAQLRALADLYAPAITFEEFERVITRDVGLSYRLLCYLNSAFFNLPRKVASVREALTILGMRAVRRWATLVALSTPARKPNELTTAALLRARLCELIGRRHPTTEVGADAFFTVGLFSLVDALVDAPLERALAALPLSDAVRAAVLERRGPMGEALAAVAAYERGDMATVARLLPGVPLARLYVAALRWADAACDALDEGVDGGAGADGRTVARD